jgi:dipeptidyl-peptidase-3
VLYREIECAIYAEAPNMFGYPSDGYQSGYFPSSPDLAKEDVEQVKSIAHQNGIELFNTRLKKNLNADEQRIALDILVASAEEPPAIKLADSEVTLVFGDHKECLSKIIEELENAQEFVANQTQCEMLRTLVQSFKTGDTNSFKNHQELWVKDRGPVVEISHGFIESYQDPQGIRCSWQGFVGVTCKSQAEMYKSLVEKAPEFMCVLPWNSSFQETLSPYENPVFNKPDFTNIDGKPPFCNIVSQADLEVLGFCCSEMWSGINLPNVRPLIWQCFAALMKIVRRHLPESRVQEPDSGKRQQ